MPHSFAITLIVCGFGVLMKWMIYVLSGLVRSCRKVCKKSRPSFAETPPVSSEALPPTITRPVDLSPAHSPTTTFMCPLCNGSLTVVPTRPEASQTCLTDQFQHVPKISHLSHSEELPILTTPPRAYHLQSRRTSFANADPFAW